MYYIRMSHLTTPLIRVCDELTWLKVISGAGVNQHSFTDVRVVALIYTIWGVGPKPGKQNKHKLFANIESFRMNIVAIKHVILKTSTLGANSPLVYWYAYIWSNSIKGNGITPNLVWCEAQLTVWSLRRMTKVSWKDSFISAIIL